MFQCNHYWLVQPTSVTTVQSDYRSVFVMAWIIPNSNQQALILTTQRKEDHFISLAGVELVGDVVRIRSDWRLGVEREECGMLWMLVNRLPADVPAADGRVGIKNKW